MTLREGDSVSEDTALLRFSAAGFLDERDLSAVVKACGEKVRAGLPEKEKGNEGLKEDLAK